MKSEIIASLLKAFQNNHPYVSKKIAIWLDLELDNYNITKKPQIRNETN